MLLVLFAFAIPAAPRFFGNGINGNVKLPVRFFFLKEKLPVSSETELMETALFSEMSEAILTSPFLRKRN